jgi:hypothetical protein
VVEENRTFSPDVLLLISMKCSCTGPFLSLSPSARLVVFGIACTTPAGSASGLFLLEGLQIALCLFQSYVHVHRQSLVKSERSATFTFV